MTADTECYCIPIQQYYFITLNVQQLLLRCQIAAVFQFQAFRKTDLTTRNKQISSLFLLKI